METLVLIACDFYLLSTTGGLFYLMCQKDPLPKPRF